MMHMHTLHSTWDLTRLLLPLFRKRQNEYMLYLAPVLWISPVGDAPCETMHSKHLWLACYKPLFNKAPFADQLFSG